MAKLWEKGQPLERIIESFTVGEDYRIDRHILAADVVASVAHARMLESIGLLSADERTGLERELRQILDDDGFRISKEDEDCHTAIENRLTERLGEAGKKIHTGRSRNDQVLTALRLLERSFLLDLAEELGRTIHAFLSFGEKYTKVPMPGRTHMQLAMPSSVGLWAGAFADAFADQLHMVESLWPLFDRSPLGSAAGYGVPLPLDRELTARLLGFSQVHTNVLAASNSRGETEGWLVSLIEQIGVVTGRFAADLLLFTLPEIGYFSLPDELCTGSSIMPQKRNPDVLELVRAKSATVSAWAAQVRSVVRVLPTGYNRDVQESKEPLLRSMQLALQLLPVVRMVVDRLVVDEERLREAFLPELFATDAVLDRVADGMSFRDAYRDVAANLDELEKRDPDAALDMRRSPGSAGNPGFESVRKRISAYEGRFGDRRAVVGRALEELVGGPVNLLARLR